MNILITVFEIVANTIAFIATKSDMALAVPAGIDSLNNLPTTEYCQYPSDWLAHPKESNRAF